MVPSGQREAKKQRERTKKTRKREATKERVFELELELIQARMIQKPLLWVEVGKSACATLEGICELRLSLPAIYDPQCP
jgi:hypothetical protein